jgi:ABC-type phosphate/phosphonate transport system substrate-binding protein
LRATVVKITSRFSDMHFAVWIVGRAAPAILFPPALRLRSADSYQERDMYRVSFWVALLGLMLGFASTAAGDEKSFKIALVQSKKGQAEQFAPMVPYLKEKGLTVELVGTKNFSDAISAFTRGDVDGMFCASGPAGILLIMDAGTPLVRPVAEDGSSGGHVVILGKKDSPSFDGKPQFFTGKKVIYPALATSGEFWFKALTAGSSVEVTTLKAASHSAAIDALAKGAADYAVVKNWVWESEKAKYADLAQVGEDKGENPENALLVTKKVDAAVSAKLSEALLALKADTGDAAMKVKSSMKILSFTKTTADDFAHTVDVLQRAGVNKQFDVASLDKK